MTSAAAALAVLDAYMAAFNARDLAAFTATINFPHVSVGAAEITVTEAGGRIPAFAATDPSSGWSYSTLDRARVVHADADKVHIDARITRHGVDGSALGVYDVIYVVTREDGRWGMKALSGLPARG